MSAAARRSGLASRGEPFFGRSAERAHLRAAIEAAVSGSGRLVLLEGEAGIGKTRLAAEAARHACARGARVVWGRAAEEAGAPAFWPWLQVLRSLLADRDGDALREALGARASELAQVMPDLVDVLRAAPAPAVADPESARFRAFEAVSGLVTRAATGTPLVVVLDDLHWADQASLRLLHFLAAGLGDVGLLVIATARSPHVGGAPTMESAFAAVARAAAARLELRGLAAADVGRLVEHTAAATPSTAVVAAVHRHTEGNPFFVSEVVRLLVLEGRLGSPSARTAPALGLPDTVRDVLARRLDRVSASCRDLLRVAAVVGREVRVDQLERLSARPRDDVLAALDEAAGAGLVTDTRGHPPAFAFGHSLMREALSAELGRAQQASLHQRLAEILEEGSGPAAGDRLHEIAHHLLAAAGIAGDPRKAAEYARRAADQAVRALAWEEAVRLYAAALGVTELLVEEARAERCTLLLALGGAADRAGDGTAAREAFTDAIELARALGAPRQLAEAVLGLGGAWLGMLRFGESDAQLVALLEEALAALPASDESLRARLLGRVAVELYFTDAATRRTGLAAEALALARRIGAPALVAEALGAYHVACAGPANAAERAAVAEEMICLADSTGALDLALAGHSWRVADLLELGDRGGVETQLARYDRLAERSRQPQYRWNVANYRAMLALLDGRLADAEVLARRALDLAEDTVIADSAALAFALQTAALLRERGRVGEAIGLMEAGVARYPAVPCFRAGVALGHVETGDIEAARVELYRLAADGFASVPRDALWLPTMALAVEVAVGAAAEGPLATLHDLLRPYAACHVVVGFGTLSLGPAALYLGLAAAALGRWGEAEVHFDLAAEQAVRMGAEAWLHRVHCLHAVALARRGDVGARARARDLAAASLPGARRLGLDWVAEQAARLAGPPPRDDGAGSRGTTAPSPTMHAGAAGVFRREGDDWTLGYDGRVVRLRDAKGLHHVAALLAAPGREMHALDLVVRGRADLRAGGEDRLSHGAGFGPLLDEQAKSAYRRRLEDLRDELEEAERLADVGRAERAREETEVLRQQVAAAVGLGGRDRDQGSAAERARVTVTKRIKDAIRRITTLHPELGHHLATCIRTGAWCVYGPPPGRRTDWVF